MSFFEKVDNKQLAKNEIVAINSEIKAASSELAELASQIARVSNLTESSDDKKLADATKHLKKALHELKNRSISKVVEQLQLIK